MPQLDVEIQQIETLQNIECNKEISEHIFSSIEPYIVSGEILEVGAGVGTYSEYLLKYGNVTAIEVSETCIKFMKKRFEKMQDLYACNLDISKCEETSTTFGTKKFDSIVCLNVLEHIQDDVSALKNIFELLKQNGRFILLVPIYKSLYGSLDINLGHFRRYSVSEILEKMSQVGFIVEDKFFINFLGIFGWFINSRILKEKKLSPHQLRLYSKLLPLVRVVDKFMRNIAGQSIIVISRK